MQCTTSFYVFSVSNTSLFPNDCCFMIVLHSKNNCADFAKVEVLYFLPFRDTKCSFCKTSSQWNTLNNQSYLSCSFCVNTIHNKCLLIGTSDTCGSLVLRESAKAVHPISLSLSLSLICLKLAFHFLSKKINGIWVYQTKTAVASANWTRGEV